MDGEEQLRVEEDQAQIKDNEGKRMMSCLVGSVLSPTQPWVEIHHVPLCPHEVNWLG